MQCAICHNDSWIAKRWCRTPCQHYICPGCLDSWMGTFFNDGKVRHCPECNDALPDNFNTNRVSPREDVQPVPIDCDVDTETQRWLDLNAKRCPQCRVWIEKRDGCDLMGCTRCYHEFCWMCLAAAAADGNHTPCPARLLQALFTPLFMIVWGIAGTLCFVIVNSPLALIVMTIFGVWRPSLDWSMRVCEAISNNGHRIGAGLAVLSFCTVVPRDTAVQKLSVWMINYHKTILGVGILGIGVIGRVAGLF